MALLKFKRSAVSGKVPALADLELGELAINTFDGKLYLRKDNGTASIIEVGAGAGSGVLSFNTRTGNVTLTSGDVTGALGYTPYNSSNPAGYITGINSSMVTTALGYTPANRAGDTFTGAITVNNGSHQVHIASDGNIEITRSGGGAYIDFKDSTGEDFDSRIQQSGTGFNLTGTVSAGNDFRAPIFYDSNDTVYFVDPNSTSVLNATRSNTIQFANGNTAITLNNGTYQILQDPTGRAAIYLGGSDPGNYYDNTTHYFRDRSAVVSMTVTSGIGQANGSFRAPIFYDSNDTSYYVDPASSSVLNTLYIRTGSIQAKFAQTSQFGYSSSYRTVVLGNEYLTTISMGVDVSGNASGSFNGQGEGREIIFRNGVNFITPNSANNGYHQVLQLSDGNGYFGNIAQAAGSLRAPIFYDSSDTSYYVNPNSVSFINQLQVATETTYPGSINGDYGGGYYHFGPGNDTPTGGYGHAHIIRLDANWNVQMFFPTSNTNEPLWLRRKQSGTYSSWRRLLQEDEWIGSKYLASDGRIYGTILYDSNDSSRYVDPNGESVLNTLTLFGELNLSAGTTYVDHTGTIVFRNQANYVNSATLTTSGDFTASGNVTAYSDARLKDNVETVSDALDLVSVMRGVTYTRKDTGQAGVGVIAQEMRKVLPQVVIQADGDDDMLSVAYGNIVGVLIEAIKELNTKVKDLEAKLRSE